MNTTEAPTDYFGLTVPLMQHLGLRPEAIAEDYCRTSLRVEPQLTNSRGDLHGGTIMAVFDFTMSAAARSHAPTTHGVITIEMSTHFLDIASGEVIIEARCLRRGRSITFCEASLINVDTGKTAAIARGSFKLIPLTPSA